MYEPTNETRWRDIEGYREAENGYNLEALHFGNLYCTRLRRFELNKVICASYDRIEFL